MRNWKGNEHWMIRDGESDPTHDPSEHGCDSCGYVDEGGVAATDLLWASAGTIAWTNAGQWLCMECD